MSGKKYIENVCPPECILAKDACVC